MENNRESMIDTLGIRSYMTRHMPEDLLKRMGAVAVPRGAYVTVKGEPVQSVQICCSGLLQVRNEFRNGMVYHYASVGPVSYIGAMEVLAGQQAYAASLQAQTACELMTLSAEDFLRWLHRDNTMALHVLRFISRAMYEQSWHSGENRIYPAEFLMMRYLADAWGKENSETLRITAAKGDIGSSFGVSVRTVQRVLKKLKHEGLVGVSRSGITVNPEQHRALMKKLEKMAEEL